MTPGKFDFWKDLEKGWIPNTITFIGIVLILPTISLLNNGTMIGGLAIFVLAWICDFLDGWSARKFNGTSQIGAFFDPLADKIFTITFLIYYWDQIAIWISVPIIALGTTLTGVRIYKINYGKKKEVEYNIMARLSGKVKANVERGAFCLIILCQTYIAYHILPEGSLHYATIIANIALGVSIIFAGFSLSHQIREIS
ncbi:CDP-alcohol phosphatidyltransferase family protein [Candidatus Kuenenbacteria bacterium]|nr:CDP-alcohol phosphatidyltransferase family protein [Candidatus Kuenenbacteria bacterium]